MSAAGELIDGAALRFRRGTPADARALSGFAARSFAEAFGAANRPEDLAAHLASAYGVPQQTRELIDPEYVSILAEDGAQLAAYAQVRRHQPPPSVTGEAPIELYRFYVDRPWHGQGLAHRLMKEVRQVAAEMGGRSLWLGVWEQNPRAIAFYQKSGFRDVGTGDFYVGPDRQTDRIMLLEFGDE